MPRTDIADISGNAFKLLHRARSAILTAKNAAHLAAFDKRVQDAGLRDIIMQTPTAQTPAWVHSELYLIVGNYCEFVGRAA